MLNGVCVNRSGDVAHLFHYEDGRFLIDALVYVRHNPKPHQGLDDFTGFDRHSLSQIPDADYIRDVDLPGNEICGFELAALLVQLKHWGRLTATTATFGFQRQLPSASAFRLRIATSVPLA